MITAMVLSILGLALVAVVMAMVRAPAGAGPAIPPAGTAPMIPPEVNPLDTDPWNARKGDVVSIVAGADDFGDLDFPIDRRGAYQAANSRWIDLSGDFRGRPVHVEVYRFPHPEVIALLDPRRLTITDAGLSEDQLAALDEKQDPAAVIEWDGRRWNYESSREISYLANETGPGVGRYRWMFTEQGGDRRLCVEKLEGEPFEVLIARRLNLQDITVYRAI